MSKISHLKKVKGHAHAHTCDVAMPRGNMTDSSSSNEVLEYLGESRWAVCFRRFETDAAERSPL